LAGLPPVLRSLAFAFADGDFSVDLGLLSLRIGFVASDIGFEAVDPASGAIKRLPHSPERLLTSSSHGGRPMDVLTIEPLLPHIGKLFALICKKLALICTTFAFVREPFTLISDPISFIRSSLFLG
jgi:hypothetical protein